MERPTSSDMMPKRDHERDLELDKKIEALRRKNEVLMKRYKEVEEDKKRAEEDGMAPQVRKGKADDLTITISKSTSESRVVVTKPFSGGSPAGKGQQEAGSDQGGEGPVPGAGKGPKKQLMVTMGGKRGKRMVSERPEKRLGAAEVKSPTEEVQARRMESAGRGKHTPQMARKEMAAQDETKQGQKHSEEQHRLHHFQDVESLQAVTDLNVPTSREEQEEYLRWKKEREQIDRERVARHKNAKGQWRRAWDMDKTENMFSDKSHPDREWGAPSRGGRNARRGQPRSSADTRGHEKKGKDKGAKNVLVMSSKAKGKDRLTGRARRWQADEGDHLQTSDTTLEEFLEELDALTSGDVESPTDQDSKTKLSLSPDFPDAADDASASPGPAAAVVLTESAPGKTDASPPRNAEKKVRFSEELVQGSHTQITGSQESAGSESSETRHEAPQQPPEGAPEDQVPETECTKKDSPLPVAPSSPPAEKACTSLQESSVQPVELAKCSISTTNTEELIDSGLSVLSLESGETNPALSTNSDKAREHGKIV